MALRSIFPTHLMSIVDPTVLDSLGSDDIRLLAGAVGVVAVLATTAAYYALSSKDKGDEFPKLQGVQLYHAWNFFQRRHDFLQSSFKRNHGKSFSFNVLHHNIVALAGEDARRVFFSDPGFDLDEGYRISKGAVHTSLLQWPDILLILILGATVQGRGHHSERKECGSGRPLLQHKGESALEQGLHTGQYV